MPNSDVCVFYGPFCSTTGSVLLLSLTATLPAICVTCTIQVEIYLDLACSDCKAAWPTIMQAAKEFGRGAEFIFRLFPLPYHSNAFTAAQVRPLACQLCHHDGGQA